MNLRPDVLVVGAGSAGIAAAVAAARKGASVVLLERHSFAGGKATGAEVGTICGLYNHSKQKESKYVCAGFAKEFAERLSRMDSSKPLSNPMGLHYLPYNPFSFKLLCDKYLKEENIEIGYHSVACNAETRNEKIHSLDAIVFDRKLTFYPAAVVDCSGEGIVSALLAEPLIEEETYQAAAQVFTLHNCKASDEAVLGMSLIKAVRKGIDEKKLDEYFDRVSIVPGSLKNGSVQIKLGIAHVISNEENKSSELEIFSRSIVNKLCVFLFAEMESFRNAGLSSVAVEAGIRTGRRPKGKYILNAQDVLSCRKFDDAVANCSWPIEMWGQDKRVSMKYFKEEDFYQIPADCLRSPNIENLFYAGRAISATDEAIASARVIGICLQTGSAAGEMAAAK
jgi:hypothetical protein